MSVPLQISCWWNLRWYSIALITFNTLWWDHILSYFPNQIRYYFRPVLCIWIWLHQYAYLHKIILGFKKLHRVSLHDFTSHLLLHYLQAWYDHWTNYFKHGLMPCEKLARRSWSTPVLDWSTSQLFSTRRNTVGGLMSKIGKHSAVNMSAEFCLWPLTTWGQQQQDNLASSMCVMFKSKTPYWVLRDSGMAWRSGYMSGLILFVKSFVGRGTQLILQAIGGLTFWKVF